MKKNRIRGETGWKKEFLDIFNHLCNKHSSWQVWQDFVGMSACAIANAVDKRSDVWQKREDDYMSMVEHYSKEEAEKICELFAIATMAFEEDQGQDFLGDLYMRLNLGNHWQGQFFTPWHICEFMAEINVDEGTQKLIEEQGYISVMDPCCGAGGLLLAFAAVCRKYGINFQQSVIFVGQDIDPVVAQMCYIQTSLIGCPGYVVIGNSLTNPVIGDTLEPAYSVPENIWFTPLYFMDSWMIKRIAGLRESIVDEKEVSKAAKEEQTQIVLRKPTILPYQMRTHQPMKEKKKKFSWKDFFASGRKPN